MITRLLAGAALAASVLVAPQVIPSASAAGPDQISVWKASGLRQTSSSYWEPTLNQPGNYTADPNYATGEAYLKLVVTSKPSAKAVQPAICFWRHGATRFQFETCAKTDSFSFTKTGTYYVALNSPVGPNADDWWIKPGGFGWATPASVGRIMIKNPGAQGALLLSKNCGGACYGNAAELEQHLPIVMDSELIFVGKGKTFSPPADWQAGCPSTWSSSCRGGGGGGGGESTTTTTTTTTPGATTTTTPSGSDLVSLTATAGNGSFQASWSHPNGLQYQFRYKATNQTGWAWDSPTRLTSRTVNGLANGTTYDVEVRTYYGGKWRPWASTTVTPVGSATTTAPTTTTPSGGGSGSTPGTASTPKLSVTAAPSALAAVWSNSSANLFQLRYKTASLTSWTWFAPASTTSRTIVGLSSGTAYDVEVRAYIGGKWRPWSSVVGIAG